MQEMPGPKRRQAEALAQNIRWLCETFGKERVGFLTLTCGDYVNGLFVKITDRKEASRRFNSLLTHVIRHRFRCGVIVTERHKDGGIHFHLIVVLDADIGTGFKWVEYDRLQGEVKRRERRGWRAVQVGASPALSGEWEFWRGKADAYGFGRCEMLPVRKTGEAVGRYVAKYVGKTWEARRPEDKGARLVRYFGHWHKEERKEGGKARSPRWSAKHGTLTPQARAWRECCKQIQLRTEGRFSPETAREFAGRWWAIHATRRIKVTVFLGAEQLPAKAFNPDLAKGLAKHNEEARAIHDKAYENWQWSKPDVPTVWETKPELWGLLPQPSDVDILKARAWNRSAQRRQLTDEDVEQMTRGNGACAPCGNRASNIRPTSGTTPRNRGNAETDSATSQATISCSNGLPGVAVCPLQT